jgi:hypothetical protein
MTFEDISIAIPPEDKTGFSSFSMPLEVSLSLSIPDFGKDGVGDQWWVKSRISYDDRLLPTDDITYQLKKHLMTTACQHMMPQSVCV